MNDLYQKLFWMIYDPFILLPSKAIEDFVDRMEKTEFIYIGDDSNLLKVKDATIKSLRRIANLVKFVEYVYKEKS